jgi:hypothetical protein
MRCSDNAIHDEDADQLLVAAEAARLVRLAVPTLYERSRLAPEKWGRVTFGRAVRFRRERILQLARLGEQQHVESDRPPPRARRRPAPGPWRGRVGSARRSERVPESQAQDCLERQSEQEPAADLLADLRRAAFDVVLGENGFDLIVEWLGERTTTAQRRVRSWLPRRGERGSALRALPLALFNRLVEQLHALRRHLRETSFTRGQAVFVAKSAANAAPSRSKREG